MNNNDYRSVNNMQPYSAAQPSVNYNITTRPLTESDLPEEFKPISAWGYFGYNLLFAIPVIGIIMLFVFALGGTKKVNLRNYARSFFCALILYLIVIAVLAATGTLSSLLSGMRN